MFYLNFFKIILNMKININYLFLLLFLLVSFTESNATVKGAINRTESSIGKDIDEGVEMKTKNIHHTSTKKLNRKERKKRKYDKLKNSTIANWGLSLGILSILLLPTIIGGTVLGFFGMICCIVLLKRLRKGKELSKKNRRKLKWGFIFSTIGFVVGFIYMMILFSALYQW